MSKVWDNDIKVDAAGNATIDGDLTVTGTTTTISTTDSVISDKLIELANGRTGTPSGDSGIIIERGSSANAAFVWDESRDEFVLGTTTATGGSTGDLTVTRGNLSVAKVGAGTEQAQAEVHAIRDIAASPTHSTTAQAIFEDDNRPGIQIVGSANNIGLIQWGDNAAAASGQLYYDHSTDKLRVDCGGSSDRLTVDSSGNLTVPGEVDAGSLDVSGDADIDGTLEADAITVDGVALNEYIADTVGAMVTSNTESGITVAYEDGDNTLDFTVGTLNQDTTGTAAIATAVTVADESSDTSCNVLFTTAATGNLEPKSGTNLTFNSSSGLLTATELALTKATLTSTSTDGIIIDQDYSTVTSSDLVGLDIDIDKTGSTTTNNTMIGINLDMDNTSATNGTNTMTGMKVTPTLIHAADAGTTLAKGIEVVVTGGTPGGSTARALDLTATGADFNQGIYMAIADGGPDIKMVSSADAGDYATIAVGAAGATTITTVDDDGAGADLTLDIDGDIVLDSEEGKWRFKTGGSGRLKIDEANSGDVQLEVAQADKKLEFKGTDGSSAITALELDMALAGQATFGGNVVIGGTTPKLTIGDAGAEDTMLVFDGNAEDFRIGLDDGTDTLEIGVGTAHGTNPIIKIDKDNNCQILYNSAVADGQFSGDVAVFQAGEDLTAGEVVYFKSDAKCWKAVATAEATSRCVAMATETIAADAMGTFLLKGFARFNSEFPTWTVGGALYTPEAETSGKNVPEQAAPADDGDFVQVIGFAFSADAVWFDPDSTVVEVA